MSFELTPGTRLLIAAALLGMLGCTTPQATEVVAEPPPLMSYSVQLPLESPVLVPGFCHLGTSCMAMDARLFEPCLLSTKRCSDRGIEPMLVAPPSAKISMPQIESL